MYVLEWRTGSTLTRGLFWCLFPKLWNNKGNWYQNNTGVGTKTICHESTCIILFLTWHSESINDDKTTIFTDRPRVWLAWFSFDWWCHNRLLMTSQFPDYCDEITWIEISNLLDINFIHSNIPSRSCKSMDIVHFSVFYGGLANVWHHKQIDYSSEV